MPGARIAIVEDMAVVRDLLAQSMEATGGHTIVGKYEQGKEALDGLRRVSADLVLLDLVLPDMTGLDVARALRRDKPLLRVVLLTASERPAAVLDAVRLGVHGIVLKGAPLATLLEAVTRVLAGGTFYCAGTAHLLRKAHAVAGGSDLSPREREVVRLIASGLSNKEVAERLALSPKTVRNHRQNIMKKIDVHNSASLTRWAVDNGVLPSGGEA